MEISTLVNKSWLFLVLFVCLEKAVIYDKAFFFYRKAKCFRLKFDIRFAVKVKIY